MGRMARPGADHRIDHRMARPLRAPVRQPPEGAGGGTPRGRRTNGGRKRRPQAKAGETVRKREEAGERGRKRDQAGGGEATRRTHARKRRLRPSPGSRRERKTAPGALAQGRWECELATPMGFEPTISTVTGWHVRPLHHGAGRRRSRADASILDGRLRPCQRDWTATRLAPYTPCRAFDPHLPHGVSRGQTHAPCPLPRR